VVENPPDPATAIEPRFTEPEADSPKPADPATAIEPSGIAPDAVIPDPAKLAEPATDIPPKVIDPVAGEVKLDDPATAIEPSTMTPVALEVATPGAIVNGIEPMMSLEPSLDARVLVPVVPVPSAVGFHITAASSECAAADEIAVAQEVIDATPTPPVNDATISQEFALATVTAVTVCVCTAVP